MKTNVAEIERIIKQLRDSADDLERMEIWDSYYLIGVDVVAYGEALKDLHRKEQANEGT
jgi:hypothetical protein